MESLESVQHIDLPIKLRTQSLGTQTYCMAAIDWVQQAVTVLNRHKDEKGELDQYVQYVWSLEVKEVAILLRNVGLGMMKIHQHVRDGRKSEEDGNTYMQEAIEVTEKAVSYVEAQLNDFALDPQPPLPAWKHQISPVGLIAEQLEVIVSQIKKIQRSDNKLDDLAGNLEDFRAAYRDILTGRLSHAEELVKLLAEIRTACQELTDANVNRLIAMLDKRVLKLEQIILDEQYEEIILDDVQELLLPFENQAGKLSVKRIDILAEVSNWTATHLWPELRAVDKDLGNLLDKAGIYLFQFSNQLKAKLDQDGKPESELEGKQLAQSIRKLENEISPEVSEKIIPQIARINQEIDTLLTTSQLFDKEANFLPGASLMQMSSTVASSLAERYSRSKLVQRVRRFLLASTSERNNKSLLQSFIADVLNHEDEGDKYSLFHRTGYMGASFTVSRPEQENMLDTHFTLWKEGFGGAICIRGAYGSGRSTLLGKYMASLPELRTYIINKGESVDVEGYKVQVDYNLVEVLQTITKHAGREKVVVAIDNFESFCETPEDLFEVFRKTQAFIRREARHIYMMVVLSNHSYRRLGMLFPLDEIFTSTVVADFASDELITQALMTRAQATFKNQQEDSYRYFSQKARQVVRHARGNIGLAMVLWGLKTCRGSAIIHPDFDKLVARYQLVLEMAATQGKIQPTCFNRMLDKEQVAAFKNAISTLLAYKIFIRGDHGLVMIHPEMRSLVETSLETLQNRQR